MDLQVSWMNWTNQVVDSDVVLVELGTGVVPADDPLPGVDLLEHGVHDLQVLVVQEPDLWVSLFFVEGNSERVGNVELNKKQ